MGRVTTIGVRCEFLSPYIFFPLYSIFSPKLSALIFPLDTSPDKAGLNNEQRPGPGDYQTEKAID